MDAGLFGLNGVICGEERGSGAADYEYFGGAGSCKGMDDLGTDFWAAAHYKCCFAAGAELRERG